MVCFSCGHYSHAKEICPKIVHDQNQGVEGDVHKGGAKTSSLLLPPSENPTNLEAYDPWMLVKRRGRWGSKVPQKSTDNKESTPSGTRFQVLESLNDKDKEQVNFIQTRIANKGPLNLGEIVK